MCTLVAPRTQPDVDDGPSIGDLHRVFGVQKAAYRLDPFPDPRGRIIAERRSAIRLPMV